MSGLTKRGNGWAVTVEIQGDLPEPDARECQAALREFADLIEMAMAEGGVN